MFKKIGFALLGAITSMNLIAGNIQSHALQPGVSLEYILPTNDGQIFINYMFWSIDAACKITTEDPSNNLLIEGLSRRGKVNDIPLSEGQSMSVIVHNGDILKLSADSGAKVKITNFGAHDVKATCVA